MAWTADQIISKAYTYAVRKSVPPATGTTKYNILLAIVDMKQKEWASEPGVDWDSLTEYDRVLSNAVSAGGVAALDVDVDHLLKDESAPVLVNGTEYTVVSPAQLYKYRNTRAVAEVKGVLTFSNPNDTNLSVGSAVTAPIIRKVGDITTGSSVIEVDEPMWLAAAVAAEFVRNDIVKAANYNLILDIADTYMEKMKERNGGSIEEVGLSWTPEGMTW